MLDPTAVSATGSPTPSEPPPPAKGLLAWFAAHPVASDVLAIVLVLGGLGTLIGGRLRQEVFPTVNFGIVSISVPYPGASPTEVERGVVEPIEEAVRGLEGVRRVRATATEQLGLLAVEFVLGTDSERALSEVKNAVDRLSNLPKEAERPVVRLVENRRHVVSVVVYGDKSEHELREMGERVRDALRDHPRIDQVELRGVRAPRLLAEVRLEELVRRGWTLAEIARRIREETVVRPAGRVRTEGGDVLVRIDERPERADELAQVPLQVRSDGTVVRLADVAEVREAFEEVDRQMRYRGHPAVLVDVYRVGNQTPLQISAASRRVLDALRPTLPGGVHVAIWADNSEMFRERIELLVRNGYLGLILVLLTLGAFLEVRLSLWVTAGIPISFLGGVLFMPFADASLNMISLFAFIVTLGMVVDDAIVVGEAIYERRERGVGRLRAAIEGVREVAVPVTFAVATTCVAFAPMLFVPGVMGKFFKVIPIVVIAVFLVSLVESLLVLPSHLARLRQRPPNRWLAPLSRMQRAVAEGLTRFVRWRYEPDLRRALRHRYLTLGIAFGILIASMGLVAGGRVPFVFMPAIDGEVVTASVRLPPGVPVAQTLQVRDAIQRAAERTIEALGAKGDVRGLLAELGSFGGFYENPMGLWRPEGGNLARVMVYLTPPEERPFETHQFADRWRREIGEMPGVEVIKLTYDAGTTGAPDIQLELSHEEPDELEAAAAELAEALSAYHGVTGVDDGRRIGKRQVEARLRGEGARIGLTELHLGAALRDAFHGAEAYRFQRGRDEVQVLVRLTERERRSLQTLERLRLSAPGAGEPVPLASVAELRTGRAYTMIRRVDGRRIQQVTADVLPGVTTPAEVLEDLEARFVPNLLHRHPGLRFGYGGDQQEQSRSVGSLLQGFALALVAIYAMLAVAFRSYLQPFIVMSAIPFGLVGAILGHLLMGYEVSLVSLMGIVALSGVVVNDSLVLVMAVNEYRRRGMPTLRAIVEGGVRRFRPILLTSLTTFFGLTPMIFERSIQARFLVPMALALGFGVLFATFVTLLIVPTLYLVVEDLSEVIRARTPDAPPATPARSAP